MDHNKMNDKDRKAEKERKRMECCNICRGTVTLELMKEEVRQMCGSLPKNHSGSESHSLMSKNLK